MKQKLILGSKSVSRRLLLEQARIPFILAQQSADETICDWNMPFIQIVKSIALQKMAHVIMDFADQKSDQLVLTADTLTQDNLGHIIGKPTDRPHAIELIKRARTQAIVTGTAFCLERRRYVNGVWQTIEQIVQYDQSSCEFSVPDQWIDFYLAHSPALECAGGIAIEGIGGQFLRRVDGAYSTIVGLPMHLVRQSLEQIGFFKAK